MQTAGEIELFIRPLRDQSEAEFCAGFIVSSDPWLTLRLPYDHALKRLRDPTREVYLAQVRDQIAGVLILHLGGSLSGYIQTLAVPSAWRNRGLGTKLIQFAEQRIFRESPNVFLCVSSFNERAQKLYQRLGYERVGELTDYVVKGYSEILMRKTRGPLFEFKPGL